MSSDVYRTHDKLKVTLADLVTELGYRHAMTNKGVQIQFMSYTIDLEVSYVNEGQNAAWKVVIKKGGAEVYAIKFDNLDNPVKTLIKNNILLNQNSHFNLHERIAKLEQKMQDMEQHTGVFTNAVLRLTDLI